MFVGNQVPSALLMMKLRDSSLLAKFQLISHLSVLVKKKKKNVRKQFVLRWISMIPPLFILESLS